MPTPKEYLDRYTYLTFPSPFTLMPVAAGLSNYGAGTNRYGSCASGAQIEAERGRFLTALRVAHHGSARTPCGTKFFFNQQPLALIPPSEDFYATSITRAFLGKGSPDEIIDTLRLASAIGRIGIGNDAAGSPAARASAQAYADAFMTLDCNGLAGNYYGVNSDGHISQFTAPGKRRTRVREVQVGDAIVTHCASAPHEHVGLIAEWTAVDDSTALVKIVEWGWYGGEDVHYTRSAARHAITRGPEVSFGIGWATKSNRKKGVDSFRYIFAPPEGQGALGWY